MAESAAASRDAPTRDVPAFSLVLPCYNEEDCLEQTVPPLAAELAAAGIDAELILVDNGSTDGTSQVIGRLIDRGLPVVKAAVPVNQGQGLGIRTGLEQARAAIVGYVGADGQVEPADVVRVYRAVRAAAVPTLAKVCRRDRDDGLYRAIVSLGYNTLMRIIFPGLRSADVNANPKVFPAEVMRQMELSSNDWFLEPEVMLKAHHLQIPLVEIEVRGKPREGGRSHVRLATIAEFVKNIARYRFGGPWREWRRRVAGRIERDIPLAR